MSVDVAELVHAVRDIYISRLFSGIAATFVVYDWLLVFGDEFETIYQSKLSLPKILFYYIRIVTPPGIIVATFRDCQGWALFVAFAMLSSLCAANGLLTLRLTALYKRRKFIVWFITIFYVATYLTTFALTLGSMVPFHATIFYSDKLHVCGSLGKTQLMPAIWYSPAAFETLVFSMTAYRVWQDASLISSPSKTPFLTMLYRDGMISFVVMAGMRIWNIWIFLTQPLSSFNMGSMLMWAINTVLTTRVYMNLVWLVHKPMLTHANGSTDEFDTTVGTLVRGAGPKHGAHGAAIKLRASAGARFDSYVYGDSSSDPTDSSTSRHLQSSVIQSVGTPLETRKANGDALTP
ncbi:hypothetical protein M408DRAFT_307708 [Serendipita vermifera MAFF 305830]|uniref:DUF6533 domain-containing protein n=1 Tax=Serendipita vermifera MAFF 305830 TaxID=933852 RepID=A0A0C3AME7_SERVB|nr:hypothetical protein M408DRAFT_307708 [Serendipita vermifera MAFF 305830]